MRLSSLLPIANYTPPAGASYVTNARGLQSVSAVVLEFLLARARDLDALLAYLAIIIMIEVETRAAHSRAFVRFCSFDL